MVRPARADATTALSESLFDEGKRLMATGDFAQACPKLEESYRLDPATGTLLNLASCHEKQGKTASAWSEFRDAAAAAKKDARTDRVKFASDHAKALEPKLSRLTISVPNDAQAPGLEVRLDGKALGSGSWGTAVPLDPGRHTITASAPGKQEWTTEIELGSKADKQQVAVPPLADAATAPAANGSTAPNAALTPAPPLATSDGKTEASMGPDKDQATTRSEWQRPVGYVLGGLGIVGLGIGTGFLISRGSKLSDRDGICPSGQHCTENDATRIDDLTQQARTASTVSAVGFVAGGVALAGGLALVLTAPAKNTAGANSLNLRLWQAGEATLVSAGGVW